MKKSLLIFLIFLSILFAFFSCSSHEHIPDTLHSVEAGCKETGLSEGRYCSECGEVLREQEVIPRIDHIPGSWTVTEEPNCIDEGEKVRFCIICSEILEREAVGAGDHDLKAISLYEYKCNYCGIEMDLTSSLKKDTNEITIANEEKITGDIRFPGNSVNSADEELRRLTGGYSTMELDKNGNYVWNDTAVLSYSGRADKDGGLILTVNIASDLKFSDGTPIKAENYLAYLLAYSSPVAGSGADAGYCLKGYDEFNKYTGSGAWSGTPYFSGIRLIDENSFSLTFDGSKGYVYDYYFAESYLVLTPYDLELVLGEDVQIKDDGKGVYLSDSWYEKASSGNGYIKSEHLETSRFDIDKYPFTGPYAVTEFDALNDICTLEINPEY